MPNINGRRLAPATCSKPHPCHCAARPCEGCVELHAGAHGRARPGRTTAALRPLCARQPPNGRRAGATRQSGGAVGEGFNIFAEGGHLRPRFLMGVRRQKGGLKAPYFGWRARRSVGRMRPCHWQRAPRDRGGCSGEHKWPQVSTRRGGSTYILATARPAQITAVWSSTPAPCCAPQGRGPGESWARGGRCARASPPTACALAPRDSRGGLCARASACLQRAGHPSRHCHGALPRGWGQRGMGCL